MIFGISGKIELAGSKPKAFVREGIGRKKTAGRFFSADKPNAGMGTIRLFSFNNKTPEGFAFGGFSYSSLNGCSNSKGASSIPSEVRK